jgi:hypothetical protein
LLEVVKANTSMKTVVPAMQDDSAVIVAVCAPPGTAAYLHLTSVLPLVVAGWALLRACVLRFCKLAFRAFASFCFFSSASVGGVLPMAPKSANSLCCQ